jgi:DNA-binding MarR family transcriptional regulator
MVLLDRERRQESSFQQDLVRLLCINKSNVTRLCSKMIERGHVTQEASPADGRAWLLGLTPAGRRLADQVEQVSRSRFDRLLAALPSKTARSEVIRSLEILNDAIAATHGWKET